MAAGARSEPIRVLIADDHRLFAQALEAILATDGRIEVVGHAGDGKEAVALTRTLSPDVVLMDINMPILDGIDATRIIVAEKTPTRILVLTGSDSPADVDRAREAGAAGYVTKDLIAAQLVDAILRVVDGPLS